MTFVVKSRSVAFSPRDVTGQNIFTSLPEKRKQFAINLVKKIKRILLLPIVE